MKGEKGWEELKRYHNCLGNWIFKQFKRLKDIQNGQKECDWLNLKLLLPKRFSALRQFLANVFLGLSKD